MKLSLLIYLFLVIIWLFLGLYVLPFGYGWHYLATTLPLMIVVCCKACKCMDRILERGNYWLNY